jgi:hypothetical protein
MDENILYSSVELRSAFERAALARNKRGRDKRNNLDKLADAVFKQALKGSAIHAKIIADILSEKRDARLFAAYILALADKHKVNPYSDPKLRAVLELGGLGTPSNGGGQTELGLNG